MWYKYIYIYVYNYVYIYMYNYIYMYIETTSHTQTCIIAGIWCVPKKYMNCHKVPLTFGDDKKQTDKTDYPDAFFVADFIYF